MRHAAVALALVCLFARAASAQCGGVERWAVKMGADSGATLVDLANPVVTTLHDLVTLPRPTLPTDEETRAAAERTVRVVEGRLVRFKQETGKTGDSDFHLVVSDNTLLYSPGGAGTQPSPHSVIAEIPDPDCVMGRNGQVTTPSRFQAQLADVRAKFLNQFPNVTTGWNEAEGMRVRLTGVGFFDRAHGQTGRALNGLELHPLLNIEFPGPVPTPPILNMGNPGFESGNTAWTSTQGVITTSSNEGAHSGSVKAWLGGYGEPHTDRLWQQVTIPNAGNTISLTFFLHIDTEESNHQAYDKLWLRIRGTNGQILQTLKIFSNQQAAPGFVLQSFNLTAYKGRTIRIDLEAVEDNGSVTSFVVDDFAIVVE